MAIVVVGDEPIKRTVTGAIAILPGTPSVFDFAVAMREFSDHVLAIADEPAQRSYGPERKGKGGKVRRW